jgi:hypothetical protein
MAETDFWWLVGNIWLAAVFMLLLIARGLDVMHKDIRELQKDVRELLRDRRR